MDARYRALDGRPPAHAHRPSTSNVSYFEEQALRVGYTTPNFRNTAEHEAVRREEEKKQIRAEIIAAETARRRALEEEVRREMMVEREMALHRGGGDRSTIFSGLDDGRFATMPFQRIAPPKITEVKPTYEVCKEKVIFLAKPEGSTSGTKRKAAFPPPEGASEPPSVGSKKKSNKEWSCALCRVSATSERGLNEHLEGKKHKSKEAKNDKGDSEKMHEKGAKRKKIQKNKDRFKFWCELCQVGPFSEKVLNRHKKGKRHAEWLERLEGKTKSGIVID